MDVGGLVQLSWISYHSLLITVITIITDIMDNLEGINGRSSVLTKGIILFYDMSVKHTKGLEWNQTQLKIALLLQQNMSLKEIVSSGLHPYTTVYKVRDAIEKGDLPHSLDEAYIAAAELPSKFGVTATVEQAPVEEAQTEDVQETVEEAQTDVATVEPVEEAQTEAAKALANVGKTPPDSEASPPVPNKTTPAPGKDGGSKKNLPGGLVKLAPYTFTSHHTQIMNIARQAAVEQWGWPQDMAFEDFVDTCLYHVFKDRGITLQGYIVDEEVKSVSS